VKKLIAIVIAIIAVLVMTVPVMAADEKDVTSGADVGGSTSGTAYMIALFSTPDEIPANGDQVDVFPEVAIPNGGNFPAAGPGTDGWKRVKFYVIANGVGQTHDEIDMVNVTVRYPDGAEKFQVSAYKVGGAWQASQSFYAPVNYPVTASGVPAVAATPPAAQTDWQVRELAWTGANFDKVDINGDCDTVDPEDLEVDDALAAWGGRVVYGTDDTETYNATSASYYLQMNEALMLELQGWIWFHQDPLLYSYSGNADSSPALINYFQFVGIVSLFTDFNNVDFGSVDKNAATDVVQGDIYLSTPLKPTIWDNGNVDAKVLVTNTKMVWQRNASLYPDIHNEPGYNDPVKTIVDFDAVLYHATAAGVPDQVGKILYQADTQTTITNELDQVPPELGPTGAVLLTACRPAKIEFSLEPNSYILNGLYGGEIEIELAPFIGS